ncbi:hypothetical protein DWW03_15630 [Alistipes sp. AF14-19]|nr:hypothetical protein DWW03_15630 [Alistipes sp. AF14-19]
MEIWIIDKCNKCRTFYKDNMIQKKANFVHLGVARRRFMTRQFDFSFPFRLLASICTILSYSGKLFIYFYFARRDKELLLKFLS